MVTFDDVCVPDINGSSHHKNSIWISLSNKKCQPSFVPSSNSLCVAPVINIFSWEWSVKKEKKWPLVRAGFYCLCITAVQKTATPVSVCSSAVEHKCCSADYSKSSICIAVGVACEQQQASKCKKKKNSPPQLWDSTRVTEFSWHIQLLCCKWKSIQRFVCMHKIFTTKRNHVIWRDYPFSHILVAVSFFFFVSKWFLQGFLTLRKIGDVNTFPINISITTLDDCFTQCGTN